MSETSFIVENAGAKEAMSRTYTKIMHYLSQSYAISDVIAEVDAALTRFTQLLTMKPKKYAKVSVTESLRCVEINDKYVLQGIFIEFLHNSVCYTMPSDKCTQPRSTIYDLACHETSLRELQKGSDAGRKKKRDYR